MATRKTRTSRPSARRATRRAAHKVNRQWTKQEISFMRKYYRKFETAWCARQLRRSVYSVRYKAVDLNLKKANPHSFRHTFCTNLVRQRVPIPVVQKLMGHADIDTTLLYTNLSLTDINDEYQKAMKELNSQLDEQFESYNDQCLKKQIADKS